MKSKILLEIYVFLRWSRFFFLIWMDIIYCYEFRINLFFIFIVIDVNIGIFVYVNNYIGMEIIFL